MKPVRVDIEWIFVSPALKTASGVVKLWEMEMGSDLTSTTKPKLLLQCNCKAVPGSRGFSAMKADKGIPTKLFKKYENYISCMLDSYFEGMLLSKNQYFWIPESLEL